VTYELMNMSQFLANCKNHEYFNIDFKGSTTLAHKKRLTENV